MKTIDLELAKELQQICKEKGITMPESELVWMPYKDIVVGRKGTHRHYFNPAFISENYRDIIKDDWHKAYTLDELLEWLPHRIKHEEHKKYYFLEMAKYNNGYNFIYQVFDSYMDDTYYEFHKLQECGDTNPANAACKLLIWLIKEGLI